MSVRELGIVLLGMTAAPRTGRAQTVLPRPDRVRLAEGMNLAAKVCDQVWPGWGHTAFQVLMVGNSAEFSHRQPAEP